MFESLRRQNIVGAAIASPLDESGGVDTVRLVHHATSLMQAGVTSVALFGTTGEGSAFDHATRLAVVEASVAAGVTPGALGMGTFEQSSSACAMHIRDAFSAGVQYALLCPPFYFKGVSDEGLYRWFAQVIDGVGATPGEFVLYHIPQLTQVPLSDALIARLLANYPERILGLKDSAGDWDASRTLIERFPDTSVLVGYEGHIAAGMQAGARGSICALANVMPEALAALIQTATQDERVCELIRVAGETFLIGAVKALLAKRYDDSAWEQVSAPLDALPESARARVLQCWSTLRH